VAAERIAQFTRDHHFEYRGFAFALRLRRIAQRRTDVRHLIDRDALRAHCARHGRPRWLPVEVDADEALLVEIDMVLLLGAPLAIVEYDRGDRDVFANAGLELAEAHAPRAIADIRDRGTIGCSHLGADNRRERIAAVAEAHRCQHRP